MAIVNLVLLVIAAVLFFLAAIGLANPSRYNLIGAGLAFWVLSEILKHLPG